MPSALVTGISRKIGIGWAVAGRLVEDGWQVSGSGWPPHDEQQPWGGESTDPVINGMSWAAADLADPTVPALLVKRHVETYGGLDALVAVHARSSRQQLVSTTAEELDASFAVNTRATVLLVQAAAKAAVRRVVLFTTGVHQDPMPEVIPYVTSKAAPQGVTATLAASLAPSGATVNCVNPGPNDTGYADAANRAVVESRMPLAPRWGQPSDVAELVCWLVSDAAAWITGQAIDSDGGWGSGPPFRLADPRSCPLLIDSSCHDRRPKP